MGKVESSFGDLAKHWRGKVFAAMPPRRVKDMKLILTALGPALQKLTEELTGPLMLGKRTKNTMFLLSLSFGFVSKHIETPGS